MKRGGDIQSACCSQRHRLCLVLLTLKLGTPWRNYKLWTIDNAVMVRSRQFGHSLACVPILHTHQHCRRWVGLSGGPSAPAGEREVFELHQ